MNNHVDVGGVIRRTFQIYGDQIPVLVPAASVVFVISSLLSVLLIAASPALAIVAFVISIIATTLFTGMVVELVADVQDGRRDSSAGQLLRAATPVLGPLILVGVLSFVIEAVAASGGTALGLVVRVIVGILTAPISALAASVLYFELRPSTTSTPPEPDPSGPFQAGGFPPAAP